MGWRKSKPFQCTICGKDFKKERQLKRHIKDAHDVDYSCGDSNEIKEVREWKKHTSLESIRTNSSQN